MERYLDLGIGEGGRYIKNRQVTRIGLDIKMDRIRVAGRDYGISGVVADVTKGLPFGDCSFTHADIILPHNELLIALTNVDLWQELARVVGSEVRVVFDTFNRDDRRKIKQDGDYTILPYVSEMMSNSARMANFSTSLIELCPERLAELGTCFSDSIIYQLITQPNRIHKVYELSAVKN